MIKKALCGMLALVLALSLSVPAFAASTLTFSDVPKGHWAYDAIMDMTERGMFNGTTTPVNGVGTFSPNTPMSRAAFIAVIVRYLYPNEIQPAAAGQQWWETSVAVAKAHGIVQDGELADMSGAMLRQEMAVILVRAAAQMGEEPERLVATTKIADYAKIDSTYRTFVRKCFTLGLICGVDSVGTFNPLGQMNRAQAATFIYRLLNKETRIAVDLTDASQTPNDNDWVNTGGTNDGTNTGLTGGNAGQLISDATLTKWGKTRPASRVNGGSWSTFNQFLFDTYGFRFILHGIGLNLDENGKFAAVSENNGSFSVEVFGWRKSYASDSATNACINMVMEAFYYGCGDMNVAYALWSWIDAASINNGANSNDYGFTDVSWSGTSGVISMNGINIGVEMPTASTIILSFD